MDSCILYLNNFVLFIFPSLFIDNPAGSCRVTASLVFHHLFRPGSFPGSIIIRNSIFATKVPLPDHSQIFIARAFTSIPKLAFLRFQCPATLRHDVAKYQTQAVMAYPSHSSTVFCVLQEKYEIVKVHLLRNGKKQKGIFSAAYSELNFKC